MTAVVDLVALQVGLKTSYNFRDELFSVYDLSLWSTRKNFILNPSIERLDPLSKEREKLEQAIAALEAQREILGDETANTLIAAAREKLSALEKETPSAEKRQLVTILFADVAGFTAMSEKLDAEDVSDILAEIWSQLDAAILRHGGHIDKHIIGLSMRIGVNTGLASIAYLKSTGEQNVIVEACQSGSFIDPAQTVSSPGRVVIGSTDACPVANASQRGAASSDVFVSALDAA